MTSLRDIDEETQLTASLFKDRVCARFEVQQTILYGSRGRQTHGPESDADVAVVLRGPRRALVPALYEMADLAFDLMLETGILVHAMPIWEDEWAAPEHCSNPALLETIDREGVRF